MGRRVSQFVNVDGNRSAGIFGGVGMKIPKTSIMVQVAPNIRFAQYGNYINGEKNITTSTYIATKFAMLMDKKDVYEFGVAIEPVYNDSRSSISTVATTHYWTGIFTVEGDYQLPGKVEIGSDVDFNLKPS